MSNENLSSDDKNILARLIAAVHATSSRANMGQTLIAVGEVWDALESIKEGEFIEINTELTLGVRHGERDFEEGLFLSIRVNGEEIVLGRTVTTYSREVGSDHETETIARLIPGESFDYEATEDWLEMIEILLLDPESTLSASRDHI